MNRGATHQNIRKSLLDIYLQYLLKQSDNQSGLFDLTPRDPSR